MTATSTSPLLEHDSIISPPHHLPLSPFSPPIFTPFIPVLNLITFSFLPNPIPPPLPIRQEELDDMKQHERLMFGFEFDVRDADEGEMRG
jgi:hypothetical protein